MKRVFSFFLSLLMVMLLIPNAAFAMVSDKVRSAGLEFSIVYSGYDSRSNDKSAYEFAIKASAAPSEAVDVTYRTFRGTTDESFYEPVDGATVRFEAGESEKVIAVASLSHDGRSLDSYVASDKALAQKYFGVVLVKVSAGTISEDGQCATAAIVDTEDDNNLVVVKKDGILNADGSGDMVERKFEHQNNAGTDGLIEGPLKTSYFNHDESTDTYHWSLYSAEHAFELDTTQHSDISSYFRLADDSQYLYTISYTLESKDPMHVYSKDVDTALILSNNGERVLTATGDLEGWRTVNSSGTIDPLLANLPSDADELKSTTKEEYCEAKGIELLGHPEELVGGYESINMSDVSGATFVSDEPIKLEGALTLYPTKGSTYSPGWEYEAELNEQSYTKTDFDYDYSLSNFLLHYGVRDQAAPQLRAQSDTKSPSAQFSQAEYTAGDTIRLSVIFDEIVASWPEDRKAHLSIPAVYGGSSAYLEMELAGGVGTNVLEFTCKYDGSGASNTFISRDCKLAIPAGIADMSGNSTQVALETNVPAAFTKVKDVTVPVAPQITAKDADGNRLLSGDVSFSDIALTCTQPDDDPVKNAVAAYEVSIDGGENWQRIEAKTDAQGANVGKPYGTFTITDKGDYNVVARALLPSDVRGDVSDIFVVYRYDEGESPGTFWIERPNNQMKVIVHREGGTVGEQVVTVRGFRVDTEDTNQLYLDRVKVDGIEDTGIVHGYYNEVTFPAGYDGTREIDITNNAWPGAEYKLGDERCKAGVELAKVTNAGGGSAGKIDRTRNSVYFDVSTSQISTKGIYNYDSSTKGPKLEPGETITTRKHVADDMIVDPGETDTVELGNPFTHVSGDEGSLDIFYAVRFGIEGSGWSFAGMYDVTSMLTNGDTQLYKGWEDYDNTHDEVNIPNNTSPINNVELNDSYITGPIKAITDEYPTGADLKFFKIEDTHGDMGTFSVSVDSRIPDNQYVNVYYLICDAYGIDYSAPRLKDWGVSDQTFYDGDEVRVYLEFAEPVVSANVSAKIWDKNHTKCYATLEASGERSAGTSDDTLMGLGSKYLMLSGFQDGNEKYMPQDALLELEVTDASDYVGNKWNDPIKPDSKYVTFDTGVPPLPDHVDDDVPPDKDQYGWFNIGWNTVENSEAGSFTINRLGTTKGRQEVFFRTLWGTNDPENPFFVPVDSSVVFEDGQKSAIIKIEEREADKNDVGYYSAISSGDYWEHDYPVKRAYGVELYDVHGGAVLNTDDMTKRRSWREAGYTFDEDDLKPWIADFDGYLYEDGKTFQRSLCEYDQAKAIAGYDGYSVETSFENDENRYFRLTCDDMYTQMHMYQNKNSFQLTVDDIYTRIYPGDGTKHELYSAHEDYDNTNQDHCYFPQDVPINSGNTIDDSAYTASVKGESIDGRDINRVWRLPVYKSDVVYNIQGYWANHVITEDGWLDYLFVDDVAPRPKTDYGAHSAFYLSDTKFSVGDFFAVTVTFDEIVLAGNDVVLEVYDANGTAKLGEILLTFDQNSGDSFKGYTSTLSFDGTMPDTYKGGSYVLKLAGTIADMAGNVMDVTNPACQERVTVESDEIKPPLSYSLDTNGASIYIDASGTTWYSRAAIHMQGDAANPAGTAIYYSLDGVNFVQGDVAELTGENKAQRVWMKCVAQNGEQSKVITCDPVAIDTVAPTIDPAVSDAWTMSPAVITTNAKDGGSGVSGVEAHGPGSASSPRGPSTVEVTENGSYDLSAVDNLGNTSEDVQIQVECIDNEAPPMPGVRSAGVSVEVSAKGNALDIGSNEAEIFCYAAKLEKSDTFTLVPSVREGVSPERYQYSYALADASGDVRGESGVCLWNRGALIDAAYAQGELTNSISISTGNGQLRGLGVYIYCEDEAGNSRKDLLVLDCDSLVAGTDVFVDSYVGTFDDKGKPQVSGAYDGGWTSQSVIFSVCSKIVWPKGVHDPEVSVQRIEYSIDDGSTWTDVKDANAVGTWRDWNPSGSGYVSERGIVGSFEIAPSADAAISKQIRFRAVASSESYAANASEDFPVNVDGRVPVASVTLLDGNGKELPLTSAADSFTNSTPVTVRMQAQAAHDAAFEMSVMGSGGWEEWCLLGETFVSGDTATFTMDESGITQMKVRVGSSTGLVSEEVPFEVRIDILPPKIDLTGYAPGNTDVENAANTLIFAIDDADPDGAVAVSGPKTLCYQVMHPDGTMRIGEGALTPAADGKSATGTVSLPYTESGEVTVFAIDGAGNESERIGRQIDESEPELAVTPQEGFVDATDPKGNKWYPNVTFRYEATDGIGGIVHVEYTENGVAKHAEGASGSFTVGTEGVYDVVVTATDASGKTAEKRFRVQIVEAAVADVANEIADLPSSGAGPEEIWKSRQDILGAVENYIELTGEQKAKMPLDQLEKLEELYEIVLPVCSVDRLDDTTGIRLIGLLFAFDPSEMEIPDDYWSSDSYPNDEFVLYEFEVKTRDLAEGGMSSEDIARVVNTAGYIYQDGHVWDVVVEKRTYSSDKAGVIEKREIIGSDRWRDSASIVGVFPYAEEFDGRDIRFMNVTQNRMEEIAYKSLDKPDGQDSASMVSARLTHLSYYGFAEKKAPVVPGGGGDVPSNDVPVDDGFKGNGPTDATPAGDSTEDSGRYGRALSDTGDGTAYVLLIFAVISGCLGVLILLHSMRTCIRKKKTSKNQ